MTSLLDRFRARLRKREDASIPRSATEGGRQDALGAARAGHAATLEHGNIPPNYFPDPVDEGRPRH